MASPKKNQLVGLDIGSNSIKLVELDQNNRGRFLKNFGIIGLPPGALVDGAIKEMDPISDAIKTLFSTMKVRNYNVATSMSGYSVIAKSLTFEGKKDEAEIEAAIREEAEQHIPFDIDDVNIDFDILSTEEDLPQDQLDRGQPDVEASSEKEGEKKDQVNVMLVAARKDIIDDYVGLIRAAGLNPGVLDVDAFALQNAVELSTEDPDGCFIIVDIGAQTLGINAVKNGVSLFSRDSSYGGQQITDAIMSEFDVDFDAAEKIKLTPLATSDMKDGLSNILSLQTASWVREIGRALDFVSSTYPEEKIKKIVITGGSSRIPGLQKYLGLELGIPIEELNPFRGILARESQFDPEYLDHVAPQAGVAVGLALRTMGDK